VARQRGRLSPSPTTSTVARAAQTVSFAYAGRSYEIDLGEKNRAKLEKALEPFISAARKADGSGRSHRFERRPPSADSRADLPVVRTWAAEHGFEVSGRGRISKKVLEAYQQAD
jgi:hypothetical protein